MGYYSAYSAYSASCWATHGNDCESFLRAKDSLAAYRSKKIVLWAVPAKSPDLNPVEMLSKPGRRTNF